MRLSLIQRERTPLWKVEARQRLYVGERTQNYHYFALYLHQLTEAGGDVVAMEIVYLNYTTVQKRFYINK
jgi:hypothetical protein